MNEGIKGRLAELLSEAASIVEEMEDCGEMVAAQKIKPGDKVRLKDEFKRHAGDFGPTTDGERGLIGVHGNDVLEISSIDGTIARFEHKTEPWCPVSWLEKVEEEAEEEPEIIAADGLPIKVGDELWFVDDGCYEKTGVSRRAKQPFRVVRIDYGGVRANSSDETDGDHTWWIRPECLTHTQPDTWERLEEDAKKRSFEYWGCEDIMCDECPEVVKKGRAMPKERYGTEKCSEAMCIEIFHRAKAIADRERCEQ